MSVQAELQRAIFDHLEASPEVMALIDGVFDQVTVDAFGSHGAYVSFGPSDVAEDDSDCITGGDHTLQLDIWSREGGSAGCKAIVDAVKRALHRADLSIEGAALVSLTVTFRRVLQDPDGLTMHGIVMLRALVEEESENA